MRIYTGDGYVTINMSHDQAYWMLMVVAWAFEETETRAVDGTISKDLQSRLRTYLLDIASAIGRKIPDSGFAYKE